MDRRVDHRLEVDSVELSFGGRPILQGVYLAVATGEVAGLLGRNGSGKSTLMKVMCGMTRATTQSLRIDGEWQERLGAEQVKYLPQHGFIPQDLRVERVLHDFGLAMDELVGWFPLFEPLRGVCVGRLSGGERRLLECYAVVCSDAQFVLLDEPFAQIAPLHVATLKELIRREASAKGIVLSDHLHEHVRDVADRLYLMTDGYTRLIQTEADLVTYGYLPRL